MADELQDVLTAVGPRLRALRKQRGVTLEQLAESTGISVSTLSRLESGGRRPTLELLLPLARAHHVPLDELVGAPASGDPRVYPRPVKHGGSTWLPLTRNPGGLNVFKQIIPADPDPPETLEQRVHEGYEWLYVISGRLRLVLGDRDFTLTAGEAAEFDTRVPHAVANGGPKPVELMNIFGPQGEQVHLRARAHQGLHGRDGPHREDTSSSTGHIEPAGDQPSGGRPKGAAMSSPGAADLTSGDDEPDPSTFEFTVPSDWDNELALAFYELVQKALDDGFPVVVAVRKDATPEQISSIVDDIRALVANAGLAAT